MTIVFQSLYEHKCIEFMNRNPRGNFLIEKDIFSGMYNVLNLG